MFSFIVVKCQNRKHISFFLFYNKLRFMVKFIGIKINLICNSVNVYIVVYRAM